MGIVLEPGTGLQFITRRTRILLIAVVIAAIGFGAPAGDANTVFASQVGTLDVTPAHTDLASTITATVFDPDLNVTVLREFETTDSTENLYALPVGVAGDTTIFKLQNAFVGDFNADGAVTLEDIQISTNSAAVQWVNRESGTFQLIHAQTVATPENFTVTYRSEHKDQTTVTLRSASNPAGFTLTLLETTPTSHTFTATFKTGGTTSTTGATSATSTTRPVIKVVDGDTITLEYSDANPAKLISEAVVVDATKPTVSVTSPTHKSSHSNTTVWARAVVTDVASGVELEQIQFHVDVDRDTIFDEPGEIITASGNNSTAINQGWNAVALLPAIATDGSTNWYVTATDRASNVGRSDAEAATGNQNHAYTVDTSPPGIIEVVLGEAYDATTEKTIGNVLNKVRVKWSESLKPSLVDATRFFIEGNAATAATMVTDIDDTVWLTFEDIPTSPRLITIMPGAVSDLTEFPSELKELTPLDNLGPRLTVSTDTAITNGLLTINVTTVETLTAAPTVTINGVTFGSAQPVDTNKWSIVVDGTSFTGSAAGDGVKNVEAAGFDAASNIARGGVAIGSTGYPTGAIQFHLDTVMKSPIVLPGDREVSLVPNPLITVSFVDEIGEYSGDTHSGVTIINAKLDGQDITSGFTAESATTWTFRPSKLNNANHTLEVVGRDDAGNTHSPVVRVFSVLVPPATATPVPTETPTPTPTVEVAPTATATEIPTEDPPIPAGVATATPKSDPVVTPGDPETPPESETPIEVAPEPTAVVVPAPTPDNEEPSVPVAGDPDAAPVDGDSEEPTPPVEPEEVPDPTAAPDPPVEDPPAEDPPTEDPPADTETEPAEGEGEVPVDEADLTEDDLAATVAAMRANDEDFAEDEADASPAPEPALTVFGCNVPTGGKEAVNHVIAGGDYLLAVAGLFGLIVARVRPRRRHKPE